MLDIRRTTMGIALLVSTLSIAAAFTTSSAPQQSADQPSAATPTAASFSGKYVGAETCATCHEDLLKNGFQATPHADLPKLKGKHGCEDCHGPGSAHVEGGGDITKIIRFTSLTAAESSSRCLDCHQFSEEHSNFRRSMHLRNNVGCVSCHSVHDAKVAPALLQAPQPQLCYGCHQEVRSDFSKPFRHRVNEGLLKCTDCHNVHGGFLTRQLRATAAQDAVCFKCHVDKTGPFVFEHVPVKTEGCMSCHQPHGSANPRLLRRAQINVLCLECHTLTVDSPAPGIPAFHNQAQRYQACTMCHVNIHGSNFSPDFFR